MSLKLIEQETPEQASLTNMLDRAHSHSAAQTLDDATISADDLSISLTENDLEDREEIDALDPTEANRSSEDGDLPETDEGSELGNALRLYLHEMGSVPRLSAQDELRLAFMVQLAAPEKQSAMH